MQNYKGNESSRLKIKQKGKPFWASLNINVKNTSNL
jgi:hypothetical protein